MEDALAPGNRFRIAARRLHVLILVVMEDALAHIEEKLEKLEGRKS